MSQEGKEAHIQDVLMAEGLVQERDSVLLRTRSPGIYLLIPAHHECWAITEGSNPRPFWPA